jgi:hypothetical protein
MNEFSHLQDYSVSTVPLHGSSPRRPEPKRSAQGRTARRVLAAGLHRLAQRLDA